MKKHLFIHNFIISFEGDNKIERILINSDRTKYTLYVIKAEDIFNIIDEIVQSKVTKQERVFKPNGKIIIKTY